MVRVALHFYLLYYVCLYSSTEDPIRAHNISFITPFNNHSKSSNNAHLKEKTFLQKSKSDSYEDNPTYRPSQSITKKQHKVSPFYSTNRQENAAEKMVTKPELHPQSIHSSTDTMRARSSGWKWVQKDTRLTIKFFPPVGYFRGESPPPDDVLLWPELGVDGERAVGVVDLGDGDRWLRSIHPRARSPVLLWRAPELSEEGCAPQWLENVAGYLLASKSSQRVNDFVTTHTQCAVIDAEYWKMTQLMCRNLQIKSTSPILVTVGDDEKARFNPRLSLTWTLKDNIMLHTLWKRHQSIKLLLARQSAPHLWHVLPYDSVTHSMLTKEDNYLWDPKNGIKIASELARIRSKNGGKTKVSIFYPSRDDFKAIYVDIKEIPEGYRILIGHYIFYIMHIVKTLNITMVRNKALIEMEKNMGTEKLNETMSDTSMFFHSAQIHLTRGKTDFQPVHTAEVSLYSRQPFEIIESSSWYSDILVIAPKAAFLPAWSLPFRVFGARIWLCVGVCVVAYALAWRRVAGEAWAGSVAAALRAFSSCGGPPQGRVKSLAGRLQLAVALLAAAVVLVAVYQGRLYTLITKPERQPEIDTFEQLGKCAYLLTYSTSHQRQLIKLKLPYEYTERELIDRRRLANMPLKANTYMDYSRLMNGEAHSVFVIKDKEWEELETLGPRVKTNYHILKEMLHTVYYFFHCKRNWPWREAVNTATLQLKEAGLLRYWEVNNLRRVALIRRLFENLHLGRSRKMKDEIQLLNGIEENTIRSFNLRNILPHLQILAFGLITSTIAFLGEILLQCRQKAYSQSEHL